MVPWIRRLRLTKGYRLAPWQSPYLRWRIETYSGLDAETITRPIFLRFCREHRAELFRYLKWTVANTR